MNGKLLFQNMMVLCKNQLNKNRYSNNRISIVPNDLLNYISSTQYMYQQRNDLMIIKFGLHFETDLFLISDKTVFYFSNFYQPRFHLFVIDGYCSKMKPSMAVFIIPQGQEHLFIFQSSQLCKIQEQCNVDRLLVISIHRDYFYNDLDNVNDKMKFS